jgi:Dihaem cytochrome c
LKIRPQSVSKNLFRGMLFALAIIAGIAGCERPLPEKGSAVEQLYVERCGTCHRPYSPQSMTAAMWRVQMEAMRGRIAAAGDPPLTSEQRREILDYLQRNSGGQ